MTMLDWYSYLKLHLRREDGQTMAEYGVVLAVVTLGIIAALGLLAAAISGKLDAVAGVLK